MSPQSFWAVTIRVLFTTMLAALLLVGAFALTEPRGASAHPSFHCAIYFNYLDRMAAAYWMGWDELGDEYYALALEYADLDC